MSLDYIFGYGTSKRIDVEGIDFEYSKKTGRIRHVIDRPTGQVMFTFRPNGSIAPTILGAQALIYSSGKKTKGFGKKRPRWIVTVLDGVSEFIAQGKTVFCRHVVSCDKSLLAGEDVVILNEKGDLLGVGKTTVPALVMKQFKKGVAVKIREGINSRDGPPTVV
jgi:conserved protein with predicted RNA binding PUA domain